jgi:hypothetical protein
VVVLGGAAAAYHYRARLREAAPAPVAPAPVATAPVVSGPLSSQEQVSGTVEYLANDPYVAGATSAPVVDEAQGTLTALPALGQVVAQGQALYGVSGEPVLLLYGTVPAYRDLALGESGADVRELNADLVALGDAAGTGLSAASSTFTEGTAYALERLQAKAGLPVTGGLPLGEALFLPGAVRVAAVEGSLGAAAAPGQAVLETTSSTEEVVAEVDPSLAAQLKVGDASTITFADGTTAPGQISYIAPVATSGQGGGGNPPTVEVDIAPAKASSVRELDNASVQVSIVTASVQSALAVPVTALLAQTGGYAVQVEGAGGAVRTVPVRLGIFDDAAGTVQVTGAGLAAGQRVVVAGQ